MTLIICWLIILGLLLTISAYSSIKEEQVFISVVITNITILVIALKILN